MRSSTRHCGSTERSNDRSTSHAAKGINNAGQIVGVGSGGAFIWANGARTELPKWMDPKAINDKGQVGGQWSSNTLPGVHAYLYDKVKSIDIGYLPGGKYADVTGINNRGEVVGWSGAGAPENHAFLYSNGRLQDLGTGLAMGINDAGLIVGCAHALSHACLWQDGKQVELASLLADPAGWSLSVATSVNARGQIAGWGNHNGAEHAFLLTPISPIGTNPPGVFRPTGRLAAGPSDGDFISPEL